MFDDIHTDQAVHGEPNQHGPARSAPGLISCGRGHPLRGDAEAFVRNRFLRCHGAHIASFMPTLLALTEPDGAIGAVTGFRCAAQSPLFLERYLATPVEVALAVHVNIPVQRARIVEVGNFAALDARRARAMMSLLPACLLALSTHWIVFTATSAIRRMLDSAGARCLELAVADGARAAGGDDDWGRYYDNDPRVMAGYLPSARHVRALWGPRHGD